MRRTRRTFSTQQKTQIAIEAICEHQPLSIIAQKYEVHPSQITAWKKQLQTGKQDTSVNEAKIALLYQQIGQLHFELDWLKKKH